MTDNTCPSDLSAGGSRLWSAITEDHDDLSVTQLVQLEEACRAKDRLDVMHGLLSESLDSAILKDANGTANLMKQLIAALRLPDESGKKPQRRGAPRGAVAPQVPGGKVSSLDRARAAKSG